MFAYDSALERYSPGRLLMGKIVEWTMNNGYSTLDLMMSTLDFKERWTDQRVDVTDYLIACSPRGRLVLGWYSSTLRHRILTLYRHKAPNRLLGFATRPLRRIAVAALMMEWGDPLQKD
jgi:CelD/BcsL family acetyltransferase involved in cellulose biosynthesis